MVFKTPTTTVLYSIEETIKAYRKLSQRNISKIVSDITVDQALTMIIVNETHGELGQSEIADLIFKDQAAMTRMLDLMVHRDYIRKVSDSHDKRKSIVQLTDKGRMILKRLQPIILENRKTALHQISMEEQKILFEILKKITVNCQSKNENKPS